MEVDEAPELVRQHSHAVLATLRRDGAPQPSPVAATVDAGGREVFSTRERRHHGPRPAGADVLDGELARLVRREGRALADRLADRDQRWWAAGPRTVPGLPGAAPDEADGEAGAPPTSRAAVVAALAARLARTAQVLEGRPAVPPLPATDDPEVLLAQLAVTADDVARALEPAVAPPPHAVRTAARALVRLLEVRAVLTGEPVPARLVARVAALAGPSGLS